MPEAAEVQVITDNLQFLVGRKVRGIFRGVKRPWIAPINLPRIINNRIESIDRVGKFIVLSLESSDKFVMHLSFTGSFSFSGTDFLALKFFLDDGQKLCFSDKRGLAKMRFMSDFEYKNDKTLSSHKVDALSSSVEKIYERLLYLKSKGVKKELKPFLLDYNYICGIGNIYASEICFHAKLNPRIRFNNLSEESLRILASSISFILLRAYKAGGSSIESFSDLFDNIGHAQEYHKVYHKEVCTECGQRILSFSQNGRTTFYCPECQKEELY